MKQNMGASSDEDRAATPSGPSQSSVVSGTAGIPSAIASLDKAMESLNELAAIAEESQRQQVAELQHLIATSGVPVFCSHNLPSDGVTILVGEALWKLLLAQGTEAGTAATAKTGAVHDGPVGNADAP